MEHEIIAVWAQVAQVFATVLIGGGQLGLIGWGLHRMRVASEERNRQLDQQAETLGQIGQALRDQGQALAELLRRTT